MTLSLETKLECNVKVRKETNCGKEASRKKNDWAHILEKDYFALEREKGQNVILGTLNGEKNQYFK